LKRILITGADGFLGKNLRLHLAERADVELRAYTRADDPAELPARVAEADVVFHLAGINRPQDPAEFQSGNADLSRLLAAAATAAARAGRRPTLVYASSTQAALDNPYGRSKREAEQALFAAAGAADLPVHVFRLPNVFGKWARPHYNSAVATFCYQIARDLPIQINDPAAVLNLVYVDDVIARFLAIMDGEVAPGAYAEVAPVYQTTIGALAEQLRHFRAGRDTLCIERVGVGLGRALYATYVSYLPPAAFAYAVPAHRDSRGSFVEMLKTPDAGQFSFFTAHPGVTRGGHYHHTKTEKFLVIKGTARFRFRHMQSGETHELHTRGEEPQIVETVPGWTHDITNVGAEEMVVMLWANEIFDRQRPDTYSCPL